MEIVTLEINNGIKAIIDAMGRGQFVKIHNKHKPAVIAYLKKRNWYEFKHHPNGTNHFELWRSPKKEKAPN